MKIALRTQDTFILGEDEKYFKLLSKYNDNDLINRLFKKYVRKDDVYSTRNVLIDLPEDPSRVQKLIEAFDDMSKGAEYFFEDYGEYTPIRIVIFDEPFCTISDNIPLEDYDNNDGEPFWVRPKYILEHYSKSNRK